VYYPLLKSQPAELKAWHRLYSNAPAICPVIQMVEPKDEASSKKYVRHLERWIEASSERSIAIVATTDSVGLLQTTLRELSPKANIRLAVPLSQCEAIWDAAVDLNQEFGSGAIVIAYAEELRNASRVISLQQTMKVDFLLRIGNLQGVPLELQAEFAEQLISRTIENGIQNLIYHGASYPADNSGMGEQAVTNVIRAEWQIYSYLRPKFNINFSDSGPLSVGDLGKSGRGSGSKVTPAIRYSTSDSWMVHRGKRANWDQWKPQVAKLCRDITDAEYYADSYFSWGDEQISAIASESTSIPGNWQGLRPIELNHHLTIAAQQTAALASRPTSPATPPVAAG
jgi:hypothetical protein